MKWLELTGELDMLLARIAYVITGRHLDVASQSEKTRYCATWNQVSDEALDVISGFPALTSLNVGVSTKFTCEVSQKCIDARPWSSTRLHRSFAAADMTILALY